MIRDLGYGESRESRSMYSEGLATSERILGATNAPRHVSPTRAYGDVTSDHAVEWRGRDNNVEEVDKRFIIRVRATERVLVWIAQWNHCAHYYYYDNNTVIVV